MTLLTPLALLLLMALPVLLWLAFRPARAQVIDVGTLMLWRLVAAAVPATARKTRRLELLLWVLAAAVLLATMGAAGPAQASAPPVPVVAVYVERLGTSGPEPELESVRKRVQEQFSEAQLHWWFAGDASQLEDLGLVQAIAAGPPRAEQAQFLAASAGASLRVMFVAEPVADAPANSLVLPRVSSQRQGVVFEVRSEGETLFVRSGPDQPPKVEGASLQGASARGAEVVRQYLARAGQVKVSTATQSISLSRQALRVGLGANWAGARHQALLAALQPAMDGATPQVWLGTSDAAPAVGISQGQVQDLAGTQIQVDLQSPLFQDLPLASLNLVGQGRVLAPRKDWRALAVVLRDGRVVGDLAALSPDGRVLEFANDPFVDSGLAAAALLLDNAIGLVTGTRASGHQLYQRMGDVLPTRRQALAAPFEARGSAEFTPGQAATQSFASWPLLLAALCSLAAAGLVARPGAGKN